MSVLEGIRYRPFPWGCKYKANFSQHMEIVCTITLRNMANIRGHTNTFLLKYRHISLESNGKLFCLSFEAVLIVVRQLLGVPGDGALRARSCQ